MASWCSSQGFLPATGSTIKVTECLADILYIIPHALFIVAILPNMLYRWIKLRKSQDAYAVRYPGHDGRWLLTIAAIYIQLLELAEGGISGSMSQGLRLHLCLPHAVAIIAAISTLVFYNFTETFNIPRYLFALMTYWCLAIIFKCVKLTSLIEKGLGFGHTRFVLVFVCLLVYLGLFCVDGYVFHKIRYFSKDRCDLVPPDEMLHVKYIHPYANFLSRITLEWLTPFLWKGYRTTLSLDDLGAVPHTEHCQMNHEKFERIYNEEKKETDGQGGPSLLKVYIRTFWRAMFFGGILKVIAELLVFFPPICVDFIVQYVQHYIEADKTNITLPLAEQYVTHGEYLSNGYVLVLVVLLANLIQGSCWQNQFYLAVKEGIRCKGAIQGMVYAKSLRLSTWSMSEGDISAGQVMNHMSVDPLHIFWLFYFGNFTWSLPLQISVGVVLLYVQLGVSGLIGAFIILISCPLNLLLAKVLADLEEEILKYSDSRLKKVNEVLQSIKLLKVYAWEMLFKRSVEKTRALELKHIFKACIVRIACGIIVDGFPLIAILVTFAVYPILEDKPLEAGKVFSSLALLNLLAVPIVAVPLIVGVLAHAYVSTNRLGKYLASPELCSNTVGTFTSDEADHGTISRDDETNKDERPELPVADESAMKIQKGTFSWDLEGKVPIIHDIELDVLSGKLHIIVGLVGSGKSSLISALVGEMTAISGSVKWRKGLTVAYGSQKAWLMNSSLKDNIIFGGELDEDRYDEVIEAAALKPDLEMLPAGDRTEIGEKGINLSGGQKQRISIARTMYSEADVILLDDPFSALDVHVGSHIFKEGIVKYLLKKGKTVVLVTHQLQFLPYAHHIVAMKDGKILEMGNLKAIKEKNIDLYNEWKSTMDNTNGSNQEDAEPQNHQEISPHEAPHHEPDRVLIGSGMKSYFSMMSLGQISGFGDDELDETLEAAILAEKNKPEEEEGDIKDDIGKLIEEEERDVGAVKANVYWSYFRSATIPLAVWTFIGYMIRQVLRMITDFWLAKWSEDSHHYYTQLEREVDLSNVTSTEETPYSFQDDEPVPDYNEKFYIGVFAGLCSAAIVFGSVASSSMYITGIKAAKTLQNTMLSSILVAPMRFYDTTPVGRIINRFAGDTDVIDHKIPAILDNVVFCVFYVIGGIVVNAISTPYFIIPVLPMLLIYFGVQQFYITSSREMQRIDNITKSPVLAHFSETLGGLTTIRAYRDQDRFQTRNWKHVDDNNTAFLYLHTANTWMGLRLDYLGAFIVFVSALCSVASGLHGWTTPGVVGLALAYAIMISGMLNWMMRYISEAEMYFNSVERVKFYSNIAAETVTQGEPVQPEKHWPGTGNISFQDVSLRYDASLDPVIEGLSLEIGGAQKIGICGRTGSGKSSLTLGLFRMIDICQGQIFIDGVDIKDIPLHLLRSRLSIIPQDPVLFEGTVRYNLDPDVKKTDKELWDALDVVQLKNTIRELADGLEAKIAGGGENFSVGQRQLFCIARAILRDSRILIMDEATASIDMQTDAMIQEVIKAAFADRTVLTIAHRVATILKCDKIIVLSQGKVIEHDSPENLMNTDSVFASLIKDNK